MMEDEDEGYQTSFEFDPDFLPAADVDLSEIDQFIAEDDLILDGEDGKEDGAM
jgi:hypothetical protein